MSYSLYLFDLDGTLYDRDKVVAALAIDQYNHFQNDLPGVTKAEYCARLIELDAHGYGPKPQVYKQLAVELGLSNRLQTQLLEHFFTTYNSFVELPEDSRLTLENLLECNVKLGLVTNGQTAVQSRKIDALGLLPYFSFTVISESVGIKKPDPAIFNYALEQSNARPDQTVFIGDHPENDIAGALNVGMAAIWKKVPYWGLAEAHADVPAVDNLREILEF